MTYNFSYLDSVNVPEVKRKIEEYHVVERRLGVNRFHSVSLNECGQLTIVSLTSSRSKAIYLGHFLSIWGHCITDNLKRLWFLQTTECSMLREKGYDLVYTLQGEQNLPSNFWELISCFGLLPNDIKKIEDSHKFQELVVPDDSLDFDHHFFPEYRETLNVIVSHILSSSVEVITDKKLYFSRLRLKNNRRDFGEYMIEDAFRKLGFTIIYPEKYSFIEQVKMLQQCNSFAATDGSIAHNAMFCRDGIECILVSKKVGVTAYQYSIMNLRSFNCYFIDSHLSIFRIFATWFGPFFMYTNDNLVRFCKDRGVAITWQFPVSLFIRYCLTCIYFLVRYRLWISFIPEADFYVDILKQNLRRKFSF